jgi:hypothetical protein
LFLTSKSKATGLEQGTETQNQTRECPCPLVACDVHPPALHITRKRGSIAHSPEFGILHKEISVPIERS